MASFELIIGNNNTLQAPGIQEGVTWQTERFGSPGKLTFKVMKDENLSFAEGNPVRFKWDGHEVFYGFVFSKRRTSNDYIDVTCYDQLRYLKNKDTYVIEDKTAGEIIQMIADDFNLQTGSVADTGYKIGSLVEDNQTLYDIIGDAMDQTTMNTGNMYILYDDFGKITLKELGDMKVDVLVDDETAQSIDYTSSIDDNSYDQVKLIYENDQTGEREVYIAKDSNHINEWGVLQLFDTIDETENGAAKAESLLKLYNERTRKLTIKGIKGDCSVRAGCLIPISLNIGDLIVNNYLLIESCKHTFEDNCHLMEIKVRGGAFNE